VRSSRGFVLLPALGSEVAFRTLVLLLVPCALALGLVELRSGQRESRWAPPRRVGAVLAAMGGIVCAGVWCQPGWDHLALTSGVNVYFSPLHVTEESRLLFFHEDHVRRLHDCRREPHRPYRRDHAGAAHQRQVSGQ